MNTHQLTTNIAKVLVIAIVSLFFIGTNATAQVTPQPEAIPRPPRKPLPEPANPKLPMLFLIGDSTVRNGQGDGGGGQWGWGEPLVEYFDATKINVVNRAVGGLSCRTYLTGRHRGRELDLLMPCECVF